MDSLGDTANSPYQPQADWPTDDPAYVPFFPPVWKVILALPALETLDCRNAPVVPLQLQRMRSLRRLKVAEYRIIASEDGSLPPLEHLELEFVTDITEDWLAPSLLRSLRMLKLRGLDHSGIHSVSKVFTVSSERLNPAPRTPCLHHHLQAAGKTSTIGSLVLNLDVETTTAPLDTSGLQGIITGAVHMPLLRFLEILSFPQAGLESTLQLFERGFAGRASKLEHFVLGVGGGRSSICNPHLLVSPAELPLRSAPP